MKQISFLIGFISILISCSDKGTETTQIGENTFVHHEKVYRIIDNEITELGNLKSDSISKSTVLNPKHKNYGSIDLDYVKRGASTDLTAVYRGDVLYFKMNLEGMNDLRKEYNGGGLSINFLDKYGFQIHSSTVEMNELIRIVEDNNITIRFEYNGKTNMSSEVYRAISDYSISSFLSKRRQW